MDVSNSLSESFVYVGGPSDFQGQNVNDGIFTWRWNNEKYLKQHIFGPGLREQDVVPSGIFKVGGFEWMLEAFPKGDDAQTAQNGIFNLYLVLNPTNYSDGTIVTVNFRMFNYEAGVSYTGITKFGESTTYDLGWSDVILKLDDLRNHKQITLGCYIKILCIEQDEPDNDNLIIYECPLRLEHPLLRCSLSDGFKFSIQWKLSDSERDLMQSARPGQSYESKIMAEMFCFRLFPNGIHSASEGEVILCLQLCLLPPGISELITRLTLRCEETGTHCKVTSKQTRTHSLEFSFDTNFYHWPETNNTTPTNTLSVSNLVQSRAQEGQFEPLFFDQFNEAESITFTAEIEVLEHYDVEDNHIETEGQWKSHYEICEHNKVPLDPPPPSKEEVDRISNVMPAELVWNITDPVMILKFYDLQQNGYYFDSTPVTIKGLEWFLRFYPRGKSRDFGSGEWRETEDGLVNVSSCSLFLCLAPSNFIDSGNVNGNDNRNDISNGHGNVSNGKVSNGNVSKIDNSNDSGNVSQQNGFHQNARKRRTNGMNRIAVDVNYRLLCPETATSHTDIVCFDEETPFHGIDTHDMKVEDLLLSGTVTIYCYLNIIKMVEKAPVKDSESKSWNEVALMNGISAQKSSVVLYETSTPVLEAMSLHKVQWNVNPLLLDQFLRCGVGKKFESPIQGGHVDNAGNGMFCLQCWPNGQDEDSYGQTLLVLQLCMFPKGVERMTLKLKLLCNELNKVWSALVVFERRGRTSKGWTAGTMLKRELNRVDSLSFLAEIVVVEQCGNNQNGQWVSLQSPPRNELSIPLGSQRMNQGESHVLDTVIMWFRQRNSSKLVDRLMAFESGKRGKVSSYRTAVRNMEKIDGLIKAYYPDAVWEWDICDENLLNHFIIAKNGDKFESDMFTIGGYKWYLKVYPNGYNRAMSGYCQVFVTLAELPESIGNILTNLRMKCPQTSTSFTFFANFSRKHKTWGWQRNLAVDELRSLFLLDKLQRLTFEIEISILKITGSPTPRVLYEHKVPTFDVMQNPLDYRYEFEWHIDDAMLALFRKSPNGKMYESAVFGDMFCLQIYPNGNKQPSHGNVQLFCQIVALPEGVSAMLVKLEMLCIESGAKWEHIVRFTVKANGNGSAFNGSNWGWSDGMMTTNDLYGFNEMTFRVRMQCIELFDENGLEMNPKWKSHSKQIADREHDEKTPNEHDASHQLLEVQNSVLVHGFTRQLAAAMEESHMERIVYLITLYSMDADESRCDWKLENAKENGLWFVMEPNQHRFISDIVGVHDFQWILESHIAAESDRGGGGGGGPRSPRSPRSPRLRRQRSSLRQDVFYAVNLSMVTMPSVISRVVISYRIHCIETGSTMTAFSVLYDEHNDIEQELRSEALLMRKQQRARWRHRGQPQSRTFLCVLNVLRIRDNDNEIIFEYPFDLKLRERFNLEWNVDDEMMSRLRFAFSGQTFESEAVFEEMWCIGIAPFGFTGERGSGAVSPTSRDTVLYLQCVCMPRGCQSVTVRVRMRCEALLYESRWTEQIMAVDDAMSTKIQFYDRTLNKLRSKGTAEVTVCCDIMVVRVNLEGDTHDFVRRRHPEIEDRISRDSRSTVSV